MLTLRFDMRAPAFGAPIADLYDAAVEMAAWAESRGARAIVLSEHHATLDNHLPSPMILASAMAARTSKVGIMLAALVLPFCDVVRLAEEMAVLDIISRGRVGYVLGIGHRREEYEHFGIDPRQRGRLADEKLALLLRLLSGEEIVHEARRIHVTPAPLRAGGPTMMIAGGSIAAARRAGRFGLGMIAQASVPGMREAYEAECRANGHPVKHLQLPVPGSPTAIFVTRDVERAWEELGPYLLHDAMTAASYRHGEDGVASISTARTVAELRDEQSAYRILTIDEAAAHLTAHKTLGLLPLCGGVPPDLAWPYLECAAAAVTLANRA